jgi:multisubunit Na+/H+ antiporter MnhG subunit
VAGVLLGDDLLPLLVLAIGAAMAFGSALALVRPPEPGTREEGELERPPLARSLVMIGVGLVAAVWALASLVAG